MNIFLAILFGIIGILALLFPFRYHIPGYVELLARIEDDEDDMNYWR